MEEQTEEEINRMIKERYTYNKICPACKKRFTTKNKQKVYCCSNCSHMKIYKKKYNNEKCEEVIKGLVKCLICGTDKDIHQHHIIPKMDYRFSDETMPLCKKHHHLIHKFLWVFRNKGYRIIKESILMDVLLKEQQ